MRFFFVISSFFSFIHATVHPISFSIPEEKIVSFIPKKEWDFAPYVPGDSKNSYIYEEEDKYREDYQRSYYAYTRIKGGADCMRHYEILANGCIPYFTDLQNVHPMTMHHFPKELVWEAMQLPGVSAGKIDHSIFDKKRYFEILEKLLVHTREHLTCRKMAQYILEKIGNPNPKKVLFLNTFPDEDYLKLMTYIGLKQHLGDKCDFYLKMDFLYQDYEKPVKNLYGRGFTYSKVLKPHKEISRKKLWSNLENGAYDVVIIGSIHRNNLSWLKVLKQFPIQSVCICGEDYDRGTKVHDCCFKGLENIFIREYTSILS